MTRDAGMRSALAKGARKSLRRFGSGLDLFAQGSAFLHVKAGRELDMLSAFEDVRTRTALADDLERFAGAETIAEIALRFGRDGADAQLFDVIGSALDALATAPARNAREATLAGAWQIVATLGFAPSLADCAECGRSLKDDARTLFTHAAGGALCAKCATLSPGGRKLPVAARAAIVAWMAGQRVKGGGGALGDTEARAHQRLLREFLAYHVHDGRPLRAYDLWEREGWSAA
jgi:DNA repair protein RecO (recombination protein O)